MARITRKPDVTTPSPSVAHDEKKRELCRAILSGTFGMRAGGERWLPRHPAEDVRVYKTRLQKAFLDNFVSQAVSETVGKLFSRGIQLKNTPPEIAELVENIDRQGTGLDPFFMDVARTAFEDGISYVIIDVPRSDGIQTLADEKISGIRPYAIHVKPSSIIEIYSEIIGGVETPVRVRVAESISVPDGEWGYTTIDQVRVWYRDADGVRWEVYRESDKRGWELYDSGETTFSEIYIVPFYTNRTGFMRGEPPFQNIAEANLEHWQWKSEHAHALSMCCFGMYWATGVPEDYVLGVGPAKSHTTTTPESRFGVLETSGVGVGLAADALHNIEKRIGSIGVNLKVENAGKVTATAAALDSEETNAAIKAIAAGFSDSIERIFEIFAEILGVRGDLGEVIVNCNFGEKRWSDAGLQELGKARALGDISRESFLAEMVRRGELPEGFDMVANEEALSQETSLADIPAAPPKATIKKIRKTETGYEITEDQK